jgi:hypothetical protein
MFFVADKPEFKKKKIREYLNREPMIAVLLAAANFEWTVSRCFFIFGKSPNVELRNRLKHCSSLERYKDFWKEELTINDASIPPLPQVIKKWNEFNKAFQLRHILIHGRGTCSRNMAMEPVEVMLAATDDLYEFTMSRGKNLHERIPVRRKKKESRHP